MAIGAHTIQPKHGSTHTSKRLGRGNGSQKGTYAGRGMKGQKARSGGKSGTSVRGFKQSLQKVPKLRGFTSMHPKAQTVTLATLERVGQTDVAVTPVFLKEAHVIKDTAHPVKIVSTGTLSKALTIIGCVATKSAIAAIEQVGGKITF